MNKIFSTMLLLATALTLSCSEDSNNDSSNGYVGDQYTGTTTITATYNGNTGSFDSEETTIYVNNRETYADVTIAKACFTKDIPFVSSDYQMPSLDIVLPNIPVVYDNTRFAIANITATMLDGEPYGDDIIKSIDNVYLFIEDETVTLTFDCTVYINLTGDGAENYTFGVSFTNEEASEPTEPEIPETSASQDYTGTIATYSIADDETETLLYSADEVTFSLIESISSATLVANGVKFTPSPYAPEMTMVIEGIDDSNGNYDYEDSDLTAYVFISGVYNTDTEITSIEVNVGSTLSTTITLIYNDAKYAISFYNQD